MYTFIAGLALLFMIVGFFTSITTVVLIKKIIEGEYFFDFLFCIVITLSVFGIYCFTILGSDASTDYSTVVDRIKIDYVTEDTENDRLVWGTGKERHFEDVDNCKVVTVDTTMYGDAMPSGLSDSDLPYYEWQRNLSHHRIKAFGKYFYEDVIKDVYVFYVPRSYLGDSPDPSVDWDSFFESKR